MLIRYLTFFGFLLLSIANCELECFSGAGDRYSVIKCPNTSTHCLSVHTLSGIAGYQCADIGLCSNYSNSSHLSIFRKNSLSCCSSSLCNYPVSPPTDSCDSITNKSSCITNNSCYWCDSSIFGVGICQSIVPSTLPCDAMYHHVVPLLCQNITCPPHTFIASHESEQRGFSYEVLTSRGYPPVRGSNLSKIAYDIAVTEVRTLSLSSAFCETDYFLQSWCGIKTSQAWESCIISEKWPQPDIYGWLYNTTYTYNHKTVWNGYPAYCFCPIKGRAIYLSQLPDISPAYNLTCSDEIPLFTMNIVLIIFYLALIVYAAFDTAYSIMYAKFKKMSLVTTTFSIKIGLIIISIFKICDQIISFTLHESTQPSKRLCYLVFVIGSIELCAIIYFLSIFTFTELVILIEEFGTANQKASKRLQFYKWFSSAVSLVVCLAGIITNILLMVYTAKYSHSLQVDDILHNYDIMLAHNKATLFILNLILAICMAISIPLLIYTFVIISRLARTPSIVKFGHLPLLERNILLCCSLISAIPIFGTFTFRAVQVWSMPDSYTWYVSEYRAQYVFEWIIFASDFSQFFWMLFCALAMRSTIEKRSIITAWLRHHYKIEKSPHNLAMENSIGGIMSERTVYDSAEEKMECVVPKQAPLT